MLVFQFPMICPSKIRRGHQDFEPALEHGADRVSDAERKAEGAEGARGAVKDGSWIGVIAPAKNVEGVP